jgi:hypothetical protein
MARTRTYCDTLTTAQVQAGITVVDGNPNRTFAVTDAFMVAAGTMTTATGVKIQDTAGVVACECGVAGLADGVLIRAGDTNFTTLTTLGAPLTPGEGIEVVADGTIAVTTAILVCIDYIIT